MRCKHPGCKSHAMKDDPQGLCFWHSPQTAEARKAAGRKGGHRNKAQVEDVDIQSVQDVLKILSEALNELRRCPTDNTLSKCRAIAYMCSIAIPAVEKGELEKRIEALEEIQSKQETA